MATIWEERRWIIVFAEEEFAKRFFEENKGMPIALKNKNVSYS